MSETKLITVARGDGIGPEIMDVVLSLLNKVTSINVEEIEIGEKLYQRGISTGIEASSWESLHRTKVFLKAPITTPQGGGFRSLNVTVRKKLGLYANVRACASYAPFVKTKHPSMDLVVIRENEEDLYTGIEYQQTREVVQCLKLLSHRGSEKIIRYAFEYALQHQRKKVTCFTKDNIMKKSDGMFHQIFKEVSKEYPNIKNEHWIVDIGMAKAATSPEQFDVIVVPNLYGDILSDITAQVSGSVGLAGSSNIGGDYAMFEAIHGSAPRRAGQNLANPSGLLLAAAEMLNHLNLSKEASLIKNAWLKTLEDGVHTYDIYREGQSQKKVGTKEFGKAIEERLGEKPKTLKASLPTQSQKLSFSVKKREKAKKELKGVDVYIDALIDDIPACISLVKELEGDLKLSSLSSRGLVFWPGEEPLADKSDHWCLRFLSEKNLSQKIIINLIIQLTDAGFECIKTENLYSFNGKDGFSKISQ